MRGDRKVDGRCRVLIVEDSKNMRMMISRFLKEEGYNLYEAADGAEAYTLANAVLPDVILMDLKMPNVDGFAATARLKHNERTKDIPIIMISALTDRKSRTRALNMGAEEFITKPIVADELRLRVRNLIRLKRAADMLKEYNQCWKRR